MAAPQFLVDVFHKNPEMLTGCELGYLIEQGDESLARAAGLEAVRRVKLAEDGPQNGIVMGENGKAKVYVDGQVIGEQG